MNNVSFKTTMLSIKRGTLLLLLLVLILSSTNVVAAKTKKTNTNKKSITTSVSKKTKKKKSKVKKKKTAKKKATKLEWEKSSRKLYALDNIIIYSKPSTDSEKISTYITNDKIKVQKISSNKKWYQVRYKGRKRYITTDDTSSNKNKRYAYKGKRLTKSAGVCNGPSGRETYYNMRMDNVISYMRYKGYSASKHPYWVRDDGAKMLGKYVMIAANLQHRPKGTLVKTSLGTGIVCDTGGFARRNPTGIDIATAW